MTLQEPLRVNLLHASSRVGYYRTRHLRGKPALRAMVRETELNVRDIIYLLFGRHGSGRKKIRSMPGMQQSG